MQVNVTIRKVDKSGQCISDNLSTMPLKEVDRRMTQYLKAFQNRENETTIVIIIDKA